ncbi:MAG: type II toxin-antitoxin system RelE/ParE family toxin [Sphingomonadales bacterium]|nr:type II toxin-antitoxin system RelE/ParE family toxin [Sphingomonadales bacterium]
MVVIVEYVDDDGGQPFAKWFGSLNTPAALKVRTSIARMESGNFSNVAPVGQGVSECKVNFGPGYRIYFGMDGEELVILLGGGTKQRQNKDIERAKRHWKAYKLRRRRS